MNCKSELFIRLVAIFIALCIVLAASGPCQAASRKPNILLIVADDLGYGELGCQGNPQIPTPNIDAIAKNGVRFTSGYVSGPYCSPTRAGLLTGRYQQRFGHEFNPGPAQRAQADFGISLTETLLPERLKKLGYATGMFGKWHLGYRPEFTPPRRGFDEYFGFLGGAHSYVDASSDPNNPILEGDKPVSAVGYTTEAFGRRAAQFIEKHREQPWFCYLPFNAVHAPLQATDKYLGRFPSVEPKNRRTFAAMLSAMDDAVGEVMQKLREFRLEEDTLVVFVSDNGGPTRLITSRNDPLRGFKTQTWEGGIRVPFMIQWKGRILAGRVDDRPVIQLDVLPTVLAAAGEAKKPEWNLDGVDLMPYLTGKKRESPHKALYWRFGQQMAIRMGDWKLVKAPGANGGTAESPGRADTSGAQLYNLKKDIGESENLADQEPRRVKELAAAWNRWNAELIDPKWRPRSGSAAAWPIRIERGGFVDGNGRPFTPRGFNYVRLSTDRGHNTFDPEHYDGVATENALQRWQADGFNVVRVFINSAAHVRGSLARTGEPGLAAGYVREVADFMRRAKQHGIGVMFCFESFPRVAPYVAGLQALPPTLSEPNAEYIEHSRVEAKARFVKDFITALKAADPDSLDSIFSYDLQNELCFHGSAPFTSESGAITAANDRTYTLPEQRQDLADDAAVYFINRLAEAIHEVHPRALVTASVFTYAAVSRSGPGDFSVKSAEWQNRVPFRPQAILRSKASILDLHFYSADEQAFERDLTSVEYDVVRRRARERGTPLFVGEFGAFKAAFANVERAATWMGTLTTLFARSGFTGWLYWTYDTHEQSSELWHACDSDGAIYRRLTASR